ncbi:MAG: SO2930 family diheme c-type cytochrome [Bacteroidota bacterium]
MWRYVLITLVVTIGLGFVPGKPDPVRQQYPNQLSEYGFFAGNIADQIPEEGVVPYDLNTPLFSDYAEKLRFVKLPEGEAVPYNETEVLNFPVGTVLIKTFYYHTDERKPAKGRNLLETRLLIHEEDGWTAIPYHWDDKQTDAFLEVAGDTKDIKWTDASGKKRKLAYSMPNMNQCKGCHSYDGAMRPIGPSARQLNGDFEYREGTANQLDSWAKRDILTDLPEEQAEIPRIAVWNDPSTGSLDQRARAWLDINCAHCHNPHGPANTSGFFLDIHQTDLGALGVNKTPVAAGRGSGGFLYDIHPGKPEKSILIHRMESVDPGVMMPEVGRKLVHEEGLALIKDWIREMK